MARAAFLQADPRLQKTILPILPYLPEEGVNIDQSLERRQEATWNAPREGENAGETAKRCHFGRYSPLVVLGTPYPQQIVLHPLIPF